MTWVGLDEFYRALDKVSKQADEAARKNVTQGAAIVVKAAQGNFEGSHKRGKPHVGGDRPNVVSGQTRRSIRMDPVEHTGLFQYSTRVGPTVRWGRALELGYLKRRGYPYFLPAAKAVQPLLAELSRRTWEQFLKP